MSLTTLIRQMATSHSMNACLATVKAVDMQAMTCDVELLDGGADVLDVRIAPDPASAGLVSVPAAGSLVLIGWLSDTEAAILMVSEMTEARAQIANATLVLTSSGLQVANEGVSLAQVLGALMQEVRGITQAIASLTVTCAAPGAPSSVPLNVATFASTGAALSQLETDLKRVLND